MSDVRWHHLRPEHVFVTVMLERRDSSIHAALAAWIVSLYLFAMPVAAGGDDASRRVVHEGIAVELELESLDLSGEGPSREGLMEGRGAAIRFKITDTSIGEPLSGLYPASWMSFLKEDEVVDAESCRAKVEEFIGGSILGQAELDLNVYYVLALNNDATISVVDPLFGFGGSKLLTMITLNAPGEDWTLSADRSLLFVTLPDTGELAVIGTADWRVLKHVKVGERPRRLALQPDGSRLWVALAGDQTGQGSGLAVLDATRGTLLKQIPTGLGPHDLAISPDNRFVYVTNGNSDILSIVDARELEMKAQIKTGDAPAAVDYSALAGMAYVSHAGDGTIAVVDGQRHEVVTRMRSTPGLGQLRIAPDGHLGFVVNPEEDTLDIFDVASNRIVQTGDMKPRPEQIAFSTSLVYILHGGHELVYMIPIDEVGREDMPVPVIDFPGGQRPFGQGVRPAMAPAIVRAPDALAVLVANPADEMIYYYKEGMAAPMGGFENYKRQPRAVLVVDRSLGERVRPGVYETAAKMRRPGRYEMAFFLDTPRIIHCFPVEVVPDPELERQRAAATPIDVEPLDTPDTVTAGESFRLRFRLTDPHTGENVDGLGDVQALAMKAGNWNRRYGARGIGDGVYEIALALPDAGSYRVLLQCRSRHLELHRSPQIVLRAVAH